jgi:uncharacterized protein YqeY
MSLEQKVMAEMKDAMKSKNEGILRALRAIKAEIIKPGQNQVLLVKFSRKRSKPFAKNDEAA